MLYHALCYDIFHIPERGNLNFVGIGPTCSIVLPFTISKHAKSLDLTFQRDFCDTSQNMFALVRMDVMFRLHFERVLAILAMDVDYLAFFGGI